jgi:small GTP-binding protein
MMQKKICLLGGFGVGKTSLVSRFVHSIFSDHYLTTIGVKIEKKTISLDAGTVDLIIWDIHGEDEFQKVNMSYLRGASGYVLVVDGTRQGTLETALALHETAQKTLGKVPCVMALNKADLEDRWEIGPAAVARLAFPVVITSAKNGAHVEETFASLARAMVAGTDTHR